MFRRPLLFLLVTALGSGMASAAMAAAGRGDGDDQSRADQGRTDQGKRESRDNEDTLSDAVRRGAEQGQVLSAERVQFDGRDVNRVKIVDDRGRVRIYVDDPGKSDPGKQVKSDGKPASRTRPDDSDAPNL